MVRVHASNLNYFHIQNRLKKKILIRKGKMREMRVEKGEEERKYRICESTNASFCKGQRNSAAKKEQRSKKYVVCLILLIYFF